jgi:hypothetical protein
MVALLAAWWPGAAEEVPVEKPVSTMEKVGRIYLFDYGEYAVEVRYLSGEKLEWKQVRGPEAGAKGVETYGYARILPEVYFLWWQEKDGSSVAQVADFERGEVHTAWIPKDGAVQHFQGKIRRPDPAKER